MVTLLKTPLHHNIVEGTTMPNTEEDQTIHANGSESSSTRSRGLTREQLYTLVLADAHDTASQIVRPIGCWSAEDLQEARDPDTTTRLLDEGCARKACPPAGLVTDDQG